MAAAVGLGGTGGAAVILLLGMMQGGLDQIPRLIPIYPGALAGAQGRFDIFLRLLPALLCGCTLNAWLQWRMGWKLMRSPAGAIGNGGMLAALAIAGTPLGALLIGGTTYLLLYLPAAVQAGGLLQGTGGGLVAAGVSLLALQFSPAAMMLFLPAAALQAAAGAAALRKIAAACEPDHDTASSHSA